MLSSVVALIRKRKTRARLFDTVGGIELVDEAASIEVLDQFCVDETLGSKIGHRGIALSHQAAQLWSKELVRCTSS
jgi:hypothetical protein